MIVPSPNSTSTHRPEIGNHDGMRSGPRRIQPTNAPFRITGSKSTKAPAAWIAPLTVREPIVTTITTHTSATNGEKLLP